MAILEKQRRNFINKPDILASKLLKIRYFPNSPNYIWRSYSQECRWKVGDGLGVCVMHDMWHRNATSAWNPSPNSIIY